MPRLLYIVLFCVTLCRIVEVAAPLLQQSAATWAAWHDQECNKEDSETEKAKYEFKEEIWIAHSVLADLDLSAIQFTSSSDHRLLQYVRRPVIPPPDLV